MWTLIPIAIATVFYVAFDVLGRFEKHVADGSKTARDRRLEQFRNEWIPDNPVVLLGSSTIEFWPMLASFPGANVINRGIGGEPIKDLRARLDAPGVLPKDSVGVVLYAGSVDFNTHGRGWNEVRKDYLALLRDIRELRPKIPILMIPVNPARDTTPERAAELDALNRSIAEDAKAAAGLPYPRMVEVGDALDTETGALSPKFSLDNWHLNEAGYAELTKRLFAAASEHGFPLP